METATYKYAVGSKVWLTKVADIQRDVCKYCGSLKNREICYKAVEKVISSIDVHISTYGVIIEYSFSSCGMQFIKEKEVFATKEEAEEYIRKFKTG